MTQSAACGVQGTEPPPFVAGKPRLSPITFLGLLSRKALPSFPRMPRTQSRQDRDFAVSSRAPWWQVPERHEGRVPRLHAHLRTRRC